MTTRITRASVLEIARQPALLAWSLYLMTIPFYVGASGLPQPSNVILVLLIPMALTGWDRRLAAGELRAVRSLLWFVLWVAVIDFGWALINSKWGLQDYVLHPFYYLFNAAIFIVVLILHRRFGALFLRATAFSIVGIVGVQVAASIVNVGIGSRGQVFFNNPNQLGYYALLAASALALLQRPTGMGRNTIAGALVACAYLATLSASRAATLGVGILFFLLVFSNPRLIAAGIFVSIVLLFVGGPVHEVIDRMEERTTLRGNENFAQVRGYNRLWDYQEHLLFGAGEGEYERFSETGKQKEIHSSVGTILFCYGVIGMSLFVAFTWRVIRNAPRRVLIMLFPTFAYAMAHHGLRFSMFWVLLAMFMAAKLPLQRST